jgi:protein subunit release factor A
MGEAMHFHPDDVEVRETRHGRKHEVTAIHTPTGTSVMKDGISFQVVRKQAMETLEKRVAERVETDEVPAERAKRDSG